MPSTYKEHHFLGNGDYAVAPKNTLSARVFAAIVDQLRSFGSPGGYPGAPIVPGFGAAQALAASDVATSLRLTTQVSANTVNEAVMTFTRNRTDTNGVGTPSASQVGMTAVDPLFPQPPEITVLGPMGSFRLFGSDPNDNHFETRTWSWGNNLRGSTASSACAAAGSSSISTTAGPIPAAPAARSRSRRSKTFWWA